MSIEKGIPIPPAQKGRQLTDLGKEVRRMQTGDSKFFSLLKERNVARTLISQLGGKSCVRRVREDGVEGWRLWRTS